MGELKIVKLRFRSALHLGANISGIGLEETLSIAHSDTLFSCLINSYAEIHTGDSSAVKKLLGLFCEGNPPFRISSAFPYQILGSSVTYYLPRPLVDPPRFFDPRVGKRIKRDYHKLVQNTQLIRFDTFKKWLGYEGTTTRIGKVELESATTEVSSFNTRELRPQHARDRLTESTQIYHTGIVHFQHGCGLYFLVELNDTAFLDWDEFRAILVQAGRNGLGGRRSHGNGVFKVAKDTISNLDSNWKELFDLPEQNGFINLSLYLPETLDDLSPVAYQLIPRRGWCYSSVTPTQMKRQTVTMFGEGSVFRNKPKGALADVTPKGFTTHKIYRYGIPISLPINILETEDDVS